MFPFFRKETEEEKQEKARQKETVDALNNDDLPPIARERIERERARGKKFFSSDLSCREFLLTKELGVETIGQVMGTSFFRVGWFGWGGRRQTSTGEVSSITASQILSRKKAVARLKKEAELLGAHGVIGVKLTKRLHPWAGGLTEFTAIGTAIRIPDWPEGAEAFTSTLNGQEFWQLWRAGYQPLGLVMGISTYYMYTDMKTRSLMQAWWGGNNQRNQEIPLYTQGIYTGRHLAMTRLEEQIRELGADGAVDMDIDPDIETIEYEINDTTYYDLMLNFVATGTAVKKGPPRGGHGKTLTVLNLSKKSFGRLTSTDAGSNYGFQGRTLSGDDDD